MKNIDKNNKIIFGLSVAIVCVSALFAIFSLLEIVYICLGFSVMSDENVLYDILNQITLGYETSLNGDDLIMGTTTVPVKDLLNLGLRMFFAISIIEFICASFELCYSVITIKNYKNKKTYKMIFTLSIIASVTSLLTLNFVNMILCIIVAILIHKTQSCHTENSIKNKKH